MAQAAGQALLGASGGAVAITSSGGAPYYLTYGNYFISIAIVAVGALFLFTVFSVCVLHAPAAAHPRQFCRHKFARPPPRPVGEPQQQMAAADMTLFTASTWSKGLRAGRRVLV